MSRIHAPRHFPERHQRNVASATGQTQTTHPSRHDEQDKKVARKLMPGFELHPRKLITHLRGGVQQGLRNLRSKPGSAARALRHQRVELSTTVLPGYNQHCDNCANLVKHYIREVDSWKRSSAGSGERSPGSTPRHNDSKIVVFDHHINLGALRTSAISSCHLCNLLDSADPGYPFTYHQHSATQYVIQINIIQDGDHHMGVLKIKGEGYISDVLNIVEGKAHSQVPATLLFSHTNASSISNLASQWLRTCIETHEDCQNRVQSLQQRPFVPTRLLRIKSAGTHILSACLVYIKSEIESCKEYVTLSHCWGGADVIRLTTLALETFRHEIPLGVLPKSFLDAFQITIQLAFDLIWIDSLCIIQDSSEDWKREANSMGDVYQHSVCTIAATGAQDSHGGCFAQRSALALIPCQLFPGDSKTPSIYMEARPAHESYKPLHSRAWALQERCLSVRTISFGNDQISWECAAAQASEQEPDMQDYLMRDLSRDFYEMLNDSNPTWTIQKWWELISEYTKCDMTFEKDKWPAIQGLALQVSKAWGTSLFYGLWSHRLMEELFWVVVGPRQERPRIDAPSWSWLSVKGQAHYKWGLWSTQNQIYAEVRKCISPLGQPPCLDELIPPELVITADLLHLHSDISQSSRDDWRLCDLSSSPHDPSTKASCQWNAKWSPDIVLDDGWDMFAVKMIGFEPIFQAGLVVVPFDKEKGLWKRVGLFEISWRTEEEWISYSESIVRGQSGESGTKMTITLV